MFRTNGYFHPANNPWAATHFAELQSLVEMLYSRSGFTPQWQQGGDDLEAIQGLKNAKLKILQCAAHHAKIVWIAILLLAEHIDRMAPPSDEFTSASVRYRSEFVLWTNWIRPVGRGTLQAYWSIVDVLWWMADIYKSTLKGVNVWEVLQGVYTFLGLFRGLCRSGDYPIVEPEDEENINNNVDAGDGINQAALEGEQATFTEFHIYSDSDDSFDIPFSPEDVPCFDYAYSMRLTAQEQSALKAFVWIFTSSSSAIVNLLRFDRNFRYALNSTIISKQELDSLSEDLRMEFDRIPWGERYYTWVEKAKGSDGKADRILRDITVDVGISERKWLRFVHAVGRVEWLV